ncbi:5,10-methylenetetrahydrofolate reductase (NAD(P)) [Desulfonauticus submarinus]|uniref:Methylenetetrahydrofolate reductase n=1 Tax=Desulfonauticus submarinus TaxID=206665 RepID=A0A1H0FMU5_9BACT|nr:methylenetetrahydrofolate reductase [NAD(P)H] [Desulfonauticus submarinus]SDN96068.1 5,10-methylenetetrahydrofolate reductase (NAD(P)) [Desulfonauticus submarinus]
MIAELLNKTDFFISLEFFPPKDREKWPSFFREVELLKKINPLFVSVTYGAGGSTRDYTLEIVKILKQDLSLEPMAHLTCVGASEQNICSFLDSLQKIKVKNILALRGDPPKGEKSFVPDSDRFKHASDLVSFIREKYGKDFSLGVAGYPEGHIEALSLESDLEFLKLKLDLGGDFVITQLFFDNNLYFDFVNRARSLGIKKPIIPGILPIMNLKGIKRITQLCGATIPEELLEKLEYAEAKKGGEGVIEVGIEHARKQFIELKEKGVCGVHFYTLNKSYACLKILDGIV